VAAQAPAPLEVDSQVSVSGSWSRKLHAIASSQLLGWLGLTCVFVAMPLFYIKHARLADPDIWWHMRTGEWILQHHQIPRVDPFSATTLGKPWVDYCWVFDVASYWIVAHFDLVSVIWFETLMRLGVAVAIFSLARNLRLEFWKAVAVTGLATLAMAWVFPPRPGAISVLFFALELHLLLVAQRKSHPRLLWFLPALFVLWANIHIEFVTGLFMLGVFCVEPLLDRLMHITRQPRSGVDVFHRQLWFVFLASCLAVLVNPYGFNLLRNVFQYARDTRIYDVILEFHAMQFRSINDWAVLSLLMLGCFALGRIRPFRPVWALLLGWSAWMSFRSLREVWLVAILSVTVIAISQGEQPGADDQGPEKNMGSSKWLRPAVAATVALILLTGASVWSVSSQKLLGQVAENFPLGAANYIRQNHLQGPLLNELSWGGFLIYSVPEIPVSMDGRTNVHSQDEILRAIPLWNGGSGWQNRPELVKANLIISDHSWPLAFLLRSDPRFRIAYEDNTSVLFEAVHAENKGSPPAPGEQ
jgi:hypothetical protein